MRVGSQLGPYHVLEVLGRGAMGAVFRAHDPRFDRIVAIKVILDRTLSDAARARFLREATALAALRHPAIVAAHDLGEDQGRLYLVLELVPGARPWNEVSPELTRAKALRALLEIARGLGHVHAQGIVHRDVKPSNILVDAEGRPFLTDFGLATADRFDRLTQTGALVGTPAYMSPEQVLADRGATGPGSDVWGLGVVLYEALTGERPFKAENLPRLLVEISEGRYVPPRRLDPTIPPAVSSVIERALERDPARRFPDGGALAAALAAALEEPQQGGFTRGWGAGVLVLAALGGALAWGLTAPGAREAAPSGSAAGDAGPADPVLDVEAELARVERLEDAGQSEAALEALDLALAQAPEAALLWARRSWLHTKAGALARGLSDAERAVELAPLAPESWRALAWVRSARHEREPALVASQRLVELAPESHDSWVVRGEILRQASRLDEARDAFERALAIEPDSPEAANDLAIVLLNQGDAVRAEALFERATELAPSQPLPWRNLALTRAQRGDSVGALALLDARLARGPEADLFLTRSQLRLRSEDLTGALDDAHEALRLRPDWAEGLTHRARLLHALGQPGEARLDAIRALDAQPVAREDLELLLELGGKLKDDALRIRVLEDTLARDATDADLWNTLAVLRERAGDTDGALEAYDRAIARRSDDAAIRFNRGELHHRLGNLAEALRDLRLAQQRLEPDEARARDAVTRMIAEIEAKLAR